MITIVARSGAMLNNQPLRNIGMLESMMSMSLENLQMRTRFYCFISQCKPNASFVTAI